jgi:hypothetical protein
MLNSAHLLMKHALTCCLNFAQSFKTCQSSLALGFICPALPTLDDSDPDPGPPLAWNPQIALATLWPPLTARLHYPHSTLPATARPHSRLPNRLGSPHPARHGSAAQDPFPTLSPLLCLSVLSTPARAPSLLSLADLLRVARLTVSCSPVSPGRDRTTHHGPARSGPRRARVWHTTPE